MKRILYWYSLFLVNVANTVLDVASGHLIVAMIAAVAAVLTGGMAFAACSNHDKNARGPVGPTGATGAMGMAGRDGVCKCKCVK